MQGVLHDVFQHARPTRGRPVNHAFNHATTVLPGAETAASTRAEMVSTLFASIAFISPRGRLFLGRDSLVSVAEARRRSLVNGWY